MSQPETCLLQNAELAVTVLPAEGGRIASLVSRRSGLEFLTQARVDRTPVAPSLKAAFRDGPCAGIEECLPTIGPCGEETEGGAAPDHGDFWQLGWDVTGTPDRAHLRLQATGFSRPLRFSKELSLEGSTLHIRYRVENLSSLPVSFLYACHPLFAVSEGDRVVLPEEIRQLELYYSLGDRLGAPGTAISWPRSVEGIDLDVAGARNAAIAEMLYTDRLQRGRCGLYRAAAGQGLILSFDAAQLPYLGLWLCYGGWPDPGVEPLQYAVALEPTFAPLNTLLGAQRANLSPVLAAGESQEWSIAFQITAPGIQLADFSL
jgi:galactose mutarotase-like enzyme